MSTPKADKRTGSVAAPAQLLALLTLLLAVGGCASVIHESPMINHDYIANPEQYEILGPVSGTATSRYAWIFPIETGQGYREAYRDALGRYPGATSLINIFSDVEQGDVTIPLLSSFFYDVGALYRVRRVKVYAVAVRAASDRPSAIADPLRGESGLLTLAQADSRVLAFARARLAHAPGEELALSELRQAWRKWAGPQAEQISEQLFRRSLRSWVVHELAIPFVVRERLFAHSLKNLRLAP